MFYAHFVLSKKGPLARIWLAAHWDKKLTRAHVFETNISSSVEAILEPKVKLALRTSGHLLLGVVRIYSRQAKYLLADCNEAFVKIKMAFRPGAEVQEEAHRDSCGLAAITLADNMHDFESTLAELTELDPYSISVNQSRPEDITMREEFGEPNLGRPDDDFGDSTFEEGGEREYSGEHVVGDVMELDDHHETELNLTSELVRSHPNQVYPEMPPSVSMASNDEFDDMMDVDYDSGENLDRNMEEAVMFQEDCGERLADSFSRVDSEMVDTTLVESTLVEEAPTGQAVALARISESVGDLVEVAEEHSSSALDIASPPPHLSVLPAAAATTVGCMTAAVTSTPVSRSVTIEEITTANTAKRLPQLVLPPVTQQHNSRADHRRTPKRKRRLLIDEHKSIPSDVMKMQMQDTSEITTRLDLAPPTRKLMLWKETGSVDSLFSTPGRSIPSRVLQRLFYRNLKTLAVPNDSRDGLPPCRILTVAPSQHSIQMEQQEDSHHNQDLYNISEIQEDLGVIQQGHQEDNRIEDDEHNRSMLTMMMAPGACSSYSANYECFSGGQPTPRRHDDDEDEEEEEDIHHQHQQQQQQLQQQQVQLSTANTVVVDPIATTLMMMTTTTTITPMVTMVTANTVNVADVSEQHSIMSLSTIEEVRKSVVSDNNILSFSTDVFDNTFNDQSIVSGGCGGGGGGDVATTVITEDGTSIDFDSHHQEHSSPHNKLQNTMLALDNELDIIDRQFPIEMTQEGLEKRSEIMLNVLQDAMKRDDLVVFQHLTVSNNKKQAASKFYTLLLLGKQKAITLHQETPFSNIIITPYQC